jgi:hypothetical protein
VLKGSHTTIDRHLGDCVPRGVRRRSGALASSAVVDVIATSERRISARLAERTTLARRRRATRGAGTR